MTLPTNLKSAEDYKKRISEALKGRKTSDETRKKQSEIKKAFYGPKKKKRIHKYSSEYYEKNKEKCLERQRRYRNNPEKREEYLKRAREKSKRWYEKNKEKRYKYNREYWKKHIISLEKEVGRKKPLYCEICKEKKRICFDHDHKTGKFRGWICDRCNLILGHINDDKRILKNLLEYLDNNTE